MIEKPASFCFRDIDRLIEAEKVSNGRVLIGTMRRYAHAFLEVVQEVGGMEKIIYGRVRDIIGLIRTSWNNHALTRDDLVTSLKLLLRIELKERRTFLNKHLLMNLGYRGHSNHRVCCNFWEGK
jgi:hypothetical protein